MVAKPLPRARSQAAAGRLWCAGRSIGDESVTAIVAVSAAALGVAIALIASRYRALRADRRMDALLTRVDEHMGSISRTRVDGGRALGRDSRGTPPSSPAHTRLRGARGRARRGSGDSRPAPCGRGSRRRARRAAPSAPRTARGSMTRCSRRHSDRRERDRLERRRWTGPTARRTRPRTVPSGPRSWSPSSRASGHRRDRSFSTTRVRSAPINASPGPAFPRRPARCSRRLDASPTLESRVLVDPATGVPNRRGYEVELAREVARARRTGRPLSLILFSRERHDVDLRF